jgi:hypothetical protein
LTRSPATKPDPLTISGTTLVTVMVGLERATPLDAATRATKRIAATKKRLISEKYAQGLPFPNP